MRSGASKCAIGSETSDRLLKYLKTIQIKISEDKYAHLVYGEDSGNTAVLFIHGFADCFTNLEMYKKYKDEGYTLYGLDLRNHGRSITNENEKFTVNKIDDYFDEIDAAVHKILEKHSKIILKGFSMGGLISSIYMHRGFYRDHISALILVSPLFRFPLTKFQRFITNLIPTFFGKIFPFIKYTINMKKFDKYVSKVYCDVEESAREELISNRQIIPVRINFFLALRAGIKELEKGLNIKKRILVVSSDKSETKFEKFNYDADGILNVKDIEERISLLGPGVNYHKVEGSMHDPFTSADKVREITYNTIFSWLKNIV